MDSLERVRNVHILKMAAEGKQGSKFFVELDGSIVSAFEVKAIIDSLPQNKELETLVLGGMEDVLDNFGSWEGCRVLQELVRTSTTLKHLSLHRVGMDAEGLKLIVEGILNNSQSTLEALNLNSSLYGTRRLKHASGTGQSTEQDVLESWRELGKLVRTSTTFKHLSLEDVGMDAEGLKLIVEGILNNSQSVLEALDLGRNQSLVSAHGTAVRDEVDEGTGQSTDQDIALESWRELGRLVQTSSTLTHLSLPRVNMQGKHLEPIVEGILNNSQSALSNLDLSHNDDFREEGSIRMTRIDDTYISDFVKQLTSLLFGNSRALATLNISEMDFTGGEMESIGKALASNTTLINLTIGYSKFKPHAAKESFKIFCDSVKFNKYLQTLNLITWIHPNKETCNHVMQMFQVNYTIREMPFLMATLDGEGRSQLAGMLKRNRRLGEYINTEGNLLVVKPSIGRLFLCGSPLAGKTTLSRSMVGIQADWRTKVQSKAKSVLQQAHFSKRRNERTQGIEVRRLNGPNGEQIALWDMAGQEEYRALHDNHYLFPEMSQACAFLYVFAPLEEEGNPMCNLNDANLRRLRKELHYWLMFINSNSRKADVITPRVMIVLTHLDKIPNKNPSKYYVDWAEPIVKDLREQFSGQVEIHNTIQAINSLSQEDACSVLKEVMTVFSGLFPKLREVPAACEKVHILLTRWAGDHKAEPIITAKKFRKLCQDTVPELKDLFQIDPAVLSIAVAQRVRPFFLDVVSYLHDLGCIIKFQESNWIVIDINWLGQTFLGKLFNPQDKTMQKMIPSTKDGIVPKRQLEDFLSKFIDDGKYKEITAEVLVELMKALKICEDGSLLGAGTESQYFMPCTLDGADTGGSKLQWTEMVHDHGCDPVYSGLRLRCKDQTRTFLSPGLFLRYQVHLLKKLAAPTYGDMHYNIKWNLIHVQHSGVEMFIESSGKLENPQYGGEDDYVDILIKYFDQRMSGKQQKYPFGISELREFCTSREGCPGVVLEEAILRPECVKRLTPCVYRRNQAVSREKLKKNMVAHLFAEIGASSEIWNTITECLFDSKIYRQRFEAVHDLKEEEVKATTLLDDWTDIQRAFDKEQISAVGQVRAIHQKLAEVQMEIKIAVDEVRRTSIPVSTSSQSSTSSFSSVTHITSSGPSVEDQKLSGSHVDHQDKNRPVTLWDMQNLERNISGRLERNRDEILTGTKTIIDSTLQGVVKDMRMILRLQQQQIDMMKNLDQKLQQIAVLPWEQTKGMPRYPYFTRYDVKLNRKILALKVVGEAYKLHFMCEEPKNPHFVTEQNGYDITTLKKGEWAKKTRPIISASVDIFLILVKVAAHVGAGIGNAIPDLSGWEGAISLTATSLGLESALNDIKMTDSSTNDHELDKEIAWKCLLDEIVKPMVEKDEFSKEFSLYQVKYKSTSRPGINQLTSNHWVCSKCRDKADKAGDLMDDYSQLKPLGVVQKSDSRHPWL